MPGLHKNKAVVKGKKKRRIDATSLLTWITVVVTVAIFWMGVTVLWEGNYISHAIARLFHTTVSHLARE